MRPNPALKRLAAATLSVIACVTVAACGGGGGESASTVQPALTTVATVTATPATPALAVTAPTSETAASDPDTALALAMAQSSGLVAAIEPQTVSAQPSPSMAQALSVFSHTESATSPSSTLATAAPAPLVATAAATSAGTTYYIDSRTGNDSNSGLSPTTTGAGTGPWRSLARLAVAALNPGDTVRLACGSEWKETLKLGSSGLAGSPITVASQPNGCSPAPTIDGSVSLPPTAWTQHQGNIYKAALPSAPLQLSSSAGYLIAGHHPNRGHDTAWPGSVYLRAAANSDKTLLNGRQVSNFVTTGTDLKLPTGATITPGTKVRIRPTAWVLDERTISAVSGTRLSLSAPTTYPLEAGWGYFLTGQLWMVDSPGEWHHDASAGQLYAWMPDSRAPSAAVLATQLSTGIDLRSQKYITVDNLRVRMAATAFDLRSSTSVTVRYSRIEDTLEHGVNAAGSVATTVKNTSMVRVGTDAVSGQDDLIASATGMVIADNTITEAGVRMNGDTVLSLPARSRAAIRAGSGATITGNTLTNTGYIGVWAGASNTISNNVITGACTVLDDCGAIYANGANNRSTITGNLIQNARGAVPGKAPQYAQSQAQGIYLDESASGVTVAGNTVIGSDNGVQVHVAANNLIKDNKLYGNRRNQIWLQETRNTDSPLGDVFGNSITGNQIVPTSAEARGLYLETQIIDTTRFAFIDLNRYLDTIYPTVAEERTPLLRTQYTLADWRAASTGGVPRALDVGGSGTSQTRFASVLMNGSNIVPNGNLASNADGWAAWNATKPYGNLTREACTPGWCASYVAGASSGILSSANFSIASGTWYRVSVDAVTGLDSQTINMVVRRGGGGSNGYESLSDRPLNLKAGRAWKRFSLIFKATKSVTAGSTLTGDLGARVDFQNIATGQTVSVANLEIVPIVPSEALTRSDILINAGTSASQATCPTAATQPTLCAIYVRLSDNQPVTWPYYLAPRSAEIIYTRDTRLIDSDGDGIPDGQDRCGSTPAGPGVNSAGCAMGE